MEALHDAYRQIHVVGDSDDHNHHYSSLEERGRLNRDVSPSSSPQHVRRSLQPASTNESGQTDHTVDSIRRSAFFLSFGKRKQCVLCSRQYPTIHHALVYF